MLTRKRPQCCWQSCYATFTRATLRTGLAGVGVTGESNARRAPPPCAVVRALERAYFPPPPSALKPPLSRTPPEPQMLRASAPGFGAATCCGPTVRPRCTPSPRPLSARPCARSRLRCVCAVEVAAAPAAQALEVLRFLSPADVHSVAQTFGTPAYVYDATTLKQQARGAPCRPQLRADNPMCSSDGLHRQTPHWPFRTPSASPSTTP